MLVFDNALDEEIAARMAEELTGSDVEFHASALG